MVNNFQLWSRATIGVVISLLIIGAILLYIIFQTRFLLIGPFLELTIEPPAVSSERFVTITGKTANITYISLNGRQIFTDQNGIFSEEIMLENGYTIATVAASDRFGRTREISREFMYLPASVDPFTTEVIIN